MVIPRLVERSYSNINVKKIFADGVPYDIKGTFEKIRTDKDDHIKAGVFFFE